MIKKNLNQILKVFGEIFIEKIVKYMLFINIIVNILKIKAFLKNLKMKKTQIKLIIL